MDNRNQDLAVPRVGTCLVPDRVSRLAAGNNHSFTYSGNCMQQPEFSHFAFS